MSTPVTHPAATDVPAATRARTPGWRDPRLWIGVLIVAASVVLGVRLLGAADDSVPVWAVTGDLGAGDTVTADDLEARSVRFVEDGDLERYLLADDPLPDDLRLTRDVGASELLPRAALGGQGADDVRRVPLAVPDVGVPPTVASGSVVDVMVSPQAGERARDAETVLEAVTVLEAPAVTSGELGAGAARQVVVGVPEDQAADLEAALGAASGGTVSLVQRD